MDGATKHRSHRNARRWLHGSATRRTFCAKSEKSLSKLSKEAGLVASLNHFLRGLPVVGVYEGPRMVVIQFCVDQLSDMQKGVIRGMRKRVSSSKACGKVLLLVFRDTIVCGDDARRLRK